MDKVTRTKTRAVKQFCKVPCRKTELLMSQLVTSASQKKFEISDMALQGF